MVVEKATLGVDGSCDTEEESKLLSGAARRLKAKAGRLGQEALSMALALEAEESQ